MLGRDKTLWLVVLVGLAAALAGSAWSALTGAGCETCRHAAGLAGGLPLGWIGVAFYGAALLMAGFSRRINRPLACAIGGAAAVHMVLLAMLMGTGTLCGPCIATGLAALAVAGAVVWAERSHLEPMLLVAPLAAGLAVGGIWTARLVQQAEYQRVAEEALAEVNSNGELPTAGRARMIVFSREGCSFCETFERDVLPEVQRLYAARLKVEHRRATHGMAAPTILVLGDRNRSIVGLPTVKELSDTVATALGDSSPS